MGLSFRSIRTAGSALLVAAAVGIGGMTGMASAHPGRVAFAGTIVDGTGAPLGGVHLTIVEELPPDGGIAAFPVTTSGDGSFGADLYAWGTAAAPASVTVRTDPDEELTIDAASCSRTLGVSVSDSRQLALSEAAPDPIELTATTTLLGEVCGTTGMPGGGSNAGGGSADGGAQITPPPTDIGLARSGGATPGRHGTALSIGFVLGLVLAAGLLVPRRGWRRRG